MNRIPCDEEKVRVVEVPQMDCKHAQTAFIGALMSSLLSLEKFGSTRWKLREFDDESVVARLHVASSASSNLAYLYKLVASFSYRFPDTTMNIVMTVPKGADESMTNAVWMQTSLLLDSRFE